MIPTVGFNMKKVTKGNVTIKMWDIGGQTRFRSMWERYCRGVNAIVYVVDAADKYKFELSKKELNELLLKPTLSGIPLLVLGNKNDLPEAVTAEELMDTLFVACFSFMMYGSLTIMCMVHVLCFLQQWFERYRRSRSLLLLDFCQEQCVH